MAAVLLRARHSQANSLSRFVCGLAELNESQFMSEVLEQIFFTPQEKLQCYSVTTRKLGSARSKRLAQESVEYFDSEDDAADFLVWRLVRPQGLKTKTITHLFLDHLGCRRVHVIITPDKWSVVSNEMGLTLPGFS
jgi:hypothetical protein